MENQSLPIDFVGALSPSHHRNLVAIPLDRFDGKVGKYSVLRTRKVVFGAMRTIVITYHEGTAGRQEKSFEAQMDRAMKEAKAYFCNNRKGAHQGSQSADGNFFKDPKNRKLPSAEVL